MGQILSRYPEGHHINSSLYIHNLYLRVPSGAVVKNPPASAGDARDMDSIPGSGRSPGGGNGNPLEYFSLTIPWAQALGRLQFMRSQKSGT